jgi:hypothetical protein
MVLSSWARRDLKRGDLSTLSELAKGTEWGMPDSDRIERLDRRGFIAKRANDKLAVTLKGRTALWVRRLSR